jgi:hypothetical protein
MITTAPPLCHLHMITLLQVSTWHTTHAGGVEVFHFPSGQREAHHPGGMKEILFPDGVARRVTPDG